MNDKELSQYLSPSILLNKEATHPRLLSRSLDRSLGFRISKIEARLLKKYRAYDRCGDDSNRKKHFQGTQTWIGLHPQVLQTPYSDLFKIFVQLKELEFGHIVDIGAGYGRIGLALLSIYPHAKFTGFEILKQRQVEGTRIFEKYDLTNARIILKNVLDIDFEIPSADAYFIYDFSEKEDVDIILSQLRDKVKQSPAYLLTAGDGVNALVDQRYRSIWKRVATNDTLSIRIYTTKNMIKETVCQLEK